MTATLPPKAPRPAPTRNQAAGMLEALTRNHHCGTACTGTTILGDGHVLRLRCPYKALDLDSQADRRTIAHLYAQEARRAMEVAR